MPTSPTIRQLSLFDKLSEDSQPSVITQATPPRAASASAVGQVVRVAPKLCNDSLDKWHYDLHMAVKHSILTYYLKIWVPHLAKTRRPLAYVDGFAGRGIYPGGELGSPLLALKVMADYAGRIDPSQRFDCYFVEKDDDNFGNMQAAVIAHPAVVGGWVRPHFFRDTFQSASQQIIRAIRLKDQPSFVFADQFGYSHAPMSVLGEVLRLPKAELLVNVAESR